jgi:hypothetical protein
MVVELPRVGLSANMSPQSGCWITQSGVVRFCAPPIRFQTGVKQPKIAFNHETQEESLVETPATIAGGKLLSLVTE